MSNKVKAKRCMHCGRVILDSDKNAFSYADGEAFGDPAVVKQMSKFLKHAHVCGKCHAMMDSMIEEE